MIRATGLKEAVAYLEKLKADIPVAVNQAMQPGEHIEQLKVIAEGVIDRELPKELKHLKPELMRMIGYAGGGSMMEFFMRQNQLQGPQLP